MTDESETELGGEEETPSSEPQRVQPYRSPMSTALLPPEQQPLPELPRLTRPPAGRRITDQSAECPECGIDLRGMNPRAHALSHWPGHLEDYPEYMEAKRRQAWLNHLAEVWGF